MTINDFAGEIRDNLLKEVEGIEEIRVKNVLKNNSVYLMALIIVEENSNISPTIYMEQFYDLYQDGEPIKEITEKVKEKYFLSRIEQRVDFGFVQCWDKIKSLVAYRVINVELNQELLKKIPHKEVMDLAKVFYISLECASGSILIDYDLCKKWNVDINDLLRVAEENTPRISPAQLKSIKEVIEEMVGHKMDIPDELYVLSNEKRIFGAATMFYPESMELVAEKLQSSFYILPSSIHELVIVPVAKGDSVCELRTMVEEVNNTDVDAVDILGNNVYYYDQEKKELSMAV